MYRIGSFVLIGIFLSLSSFSVYAEGEIPSSIFCSLKLLGVAITANDGRIAILDNGTIQIDRRLALMLAEEKVNSLWDEDPASVPGGSTATVSRFWAQMVRESKRAIERLVLRALGDPEDVPGETPSRTIIWTRS